MQFQFSDKNPHHPVTYASFFSMHTRIELVATGFTEEKGRELAQSIEAEVKAMEHRFNRFDDTSPMSVVNMRATNEAVTVDDELFMALELCEAFRRGTGGYFDVATASAATDEGYAVSYLLDPKKHTVKFTHQGVSLDLGGFAKGFALEQVCRRVREAGAENALINFGNSSVAAIGHHPYGECWSVGVEHTKVKGTMAREIKLNNGAMSVSGRNSDGVYHIVNPITGGLVAGDELVIVEGRSALVCEVLSTALYAAPRAQRSVIMKQYEGYTATELYCREGGSCEIRTIDCNK
ncbi:MAG: FAD:protein FMN transferase [Alistipes sp.]|nr:FAD:protein FMN transferase [Alistipes sp.]